ncbi:MAG: hypothetical protein M3O32_00240 [Actinomycetota bacterium]|nr:hypothetical protein [Actinomycetota bacterium]
MPNANFAGEPSVGADWRTGALLYQASTSTYRITFGGRGAQTVAARRDVTPADSLISDDPILAVDPKTGLALAGGGAASCGALSVTGDDGASWRPSVPCTGTPDHPTVSIGASGAGLLATEGGRAVYYCQQYPLEDECTVRQDAGVSWFPAEPVTAGRMGSPATSR